MTGSIGVVTNPRSRGRHTPGALAYVLGERGELVAPGDLDALAAHARRFRDRGITTLCVDGGDGTLHRVLTAIARVYGDAPLVDAVATADAATGQSALFLVNRSQTEAIDVTVNVSDLNATVVTEAVTLHDADVYAKNTLQDQNRVGLKQLDGAVLEEGTLTVTLPPVSWSAVALG